MATCVMSGNSFEYSDFSIWTWEANVFEHDRWGPCPCKVYETKSCVGLRYMNRNKTKTAHTLNAQCLGDSDNLANMMKPRRVCPRVKRR
jgi:hypothetical protein